MLQIDLHENQIEFAITFNGTNNFMEIKDDVKDIPSRRFDMDSKAWLVPVSQNSFESMKALAEKWGFTITEKANEALTLAKIKGEERVGMSKALAAKNATQFDFSDIELKPMDHQIAALEYAIDTISNNRGLLIADEQGLGKTSESLLIAKHFKANKIVVVCPKSLKSNWRKEIKMWCPALSTFIVDAKNKKDHDEMMKYDVIVTHYDTIRDVREDPTSNSPSTKFYAEAGSLLYFLMNDFNPAAVIVDESHRIASYKSLQSRGVKMLMRRRKIRMCLTGTPVVNKPQDLISQLTALGQLESLGGFHYFREHYCGIREGVYGEGTPQNLVELHNRLGSTCLWYNSQVETEFGSMKIGDIVEQKKQIRVLSMDIYGELQFRRITGFSKRVYHGAMARIRTRENEIYCTPDHKIYTSQGYIQAQALNCRSVLLELQEEISETMEQPTGASSEILFQNMRGSSGIQKREGTSSVACNQKTEQRRGRNDNLRVVQKTTGRPQHSIKNKQKILLEVVQLQVSAYSTLVERNRQENDCCWNQAPYRTTQSSAVRSNEGIQVEAGIHRQDDSHDESEGKDSAKNRAYISRGENATRCSWMARGIPGIHSRNRKVKRKVRCRKMVLATPGYSRTNQKTMYRNRRNESPTQETEDKRCMEGKKTQESRVDSVEIFQPTSYDRLAIGGQENSLVYDIEVDGNHNFFANNVLVSNCYLRRMKKDVLTSLPPIMYSRVVVEISNRKEYDKAENNLEDYLRGEGYDEERIASSTNNERLTRIEHLKQIAAKGKLEAVIDWIKSFVDAGTKIVVFAHHIEIQRAIYDAFPNQSARIASQGEMGISDSKYADEIEKEKNKFQTDPDCLVMVASLKTGQEGHTLTAASNVAFVEFGWTPKDHAQGVARVHRISQQNSVMAWWIEAEDTIEQDIIDILQKKQHIVNGVVDGQEDRVSQEYTKSIFGELVKRIEAKKR